jgi:prolyl-tRNA synthetase
MFSEMDLIGIPHRLVIGERGLKSGTVEYRNRRDQAARDYPLETLVETLKTLSNI